MTTAPIFSLVESIHDVDVIAIPVAKGPVLFEGTDHYGIDVSVLEAAGFEGNPGEVLVLHGASQSKVAVGVGISSKVNVHVLRRAAAAVIRASWKRTSVALCLLEAIPDGTDRKEATKALLEGAGLSAYRYTALKSDPKPCKVAEVCVLTESGTSQELQGALEQAIATVEAVYLARDLVNEPPGSMSPVRMAEIAVEVAQRSGLEVEVIDEDMARDMGLGGLLGVARGSEHPPRLVKLTYEPAANSSRSDSVALVGKGITFDSGGLSLKPGDAMMTMKCDMAGAAAVLATMSVLPKMQPDMKVTGYMALAENMPSGDAIKPGDVLRTRAGKTVEVLNTDAEGRLVLADALALAVEDGANAIIDLATLTGACVVALGTRIAGLMGTSSELIDQLKISATKADESVWPLPLPSEYRKQIDSDIADLKNIGNGRNAGTLTAGLFLQEFTNKVPWAHLDIAGPAFVDADEAWVAKGATGFGVRLLLSFLENYEVVSAETDDSDDDNGAA